MVDTFEILDELKLDFEPKQAERLARMMGQMYRELAETVKRADFEVLQNVLSRLSDNVEALSEKVNELAEAQKRTELRVGELTRAQHELAEAQKRTEIRLSELAEAQKRTEIRLNELAEAQKITEQRVNELTEAQKRTEIRLSELAEAQKITEQRVNELTEAQKRTEIRLNELAEAQKITEQRVNELTEAQKRTELRVEELTKAQYKTENELKRLAEALNETREQLGGISDTIGYTLENEAFKALPNLLHRDYGLVVVGRLKRGYIKDKKGRPIEVNIIGEATSNGKKVSIIGECKVRLSKKAIKEFVKRRVEAFKGRVEGEIFPVLVTHMISEANAEDFARDNDIALYYSYDF